MTKKVDQLAQFADLKRELGKKEGGRGGGGVFEGGEECEGLIPQCAL